MKNKLDYPGQSKGSGGKKPNRDLIWNVLTGVMLLGTLSVSIFFVHLLTNPFSGLNPLPGPTLTLTPIPATITPLALEATWTPTITVEPSSTTTPRPTFTLEATATTFVIASPTSAFFTPTTPTRTPKPTGVPYAATINYYDSTSFRPDTNCTMMLVVGETKDSGNNPVIGLIVKLGGSVPGKVFNPPLTSLAGIAKGYGQSGFEFDPGMQPVATKDSLWVQLFDQASTPISEQVYIETYKDCKKNLIFVRFLQR